MAEFKLGRIRFVWKGSWSAANVYYQDDVVSFGGKTYICTIGHTSQSDFFTDFDIVPPKWNLVSDGQTWKGEWTTDTLYYVDEIVSYGARLYIANTKHTSAATAVDATDGLEVDIAKWDAYAEGLYWKGDWSISTRYRVNDFVKYGGSTYVCNTLHVSTATAADGLEADISNWDTFNQGLEYKGNWATSTRYKYNDLVRYGAGVWICTTAHTSTTDLGTDTAYWSKFVEGFQYENDWSPFRSYQPGDVVRYGGNQYISKTNHTEVIPGPQSGKITAITSAQPAVVTSAGHGLQDGRKITFANIEGMTELNDVTAYVKLVDANSFELYENETLLTPVNATGFTTYTQNGIYTSTAPTDWDIFTEGFRFIGDWNDDSANQQYKVGEVVRLGGFTYVCILDHSGYQPPNTLYWTKINEGVRWRGEWLDDQEYYEGDTVRYGSNSYICIKYHISEGDDYSTETPLGAGGGAEGSRPDLADSGQYWAVMAIGSEVSVLTTTGDLVFYNGSAPTRLPVGLEGQVLTVGLDSTPTWEFLQSVEDVYYVAEHGIDRPYPESGRTIDRPYKSIRYACEQIEKGPKNPNAQYLLELNRVFIQEEVGSYINYQIANAGGSGIWNNFVYGEDKCKRDVGYIVDRLRWDIGHGGNLKSRAAALSFVNGFSANGEFSDASEDQVYGGSGLAAESAQSVAAYNYMLTVIDAVLKNQAPSTIYQNVSDDSTAIVTQFTSATLTAETGVYTKIQSLVKIITDTITAGDTSEVPARDVPQTLVKVSTGEHYEYLPIRVPAYCAILGDELRSTKIIAAGKTTPAKDTYYTVDTFDRVAEVVKDVVTGTTVTPTVGNTEPQSQEWPLAITDQANKVESLVDVMKYQIDYGLNSMEAAYVNDPITLAEADENAVANIKLNIDFLLAEVIAYLDAEYPTLKYGKTAKRRDARYIIDSLIYDLTYGGNSLAVITGLAYYDGDDNTKPVLPTSVKTEFKAAINYLKTTAQSVAQDASVVSPKQTAVIQQLTGNTGNFAAIANNIEDIIEIIDTGPAAVGTTVTLVNPTLANDVNSTTALISAKSALDTATASIKTDTTSWISANFPTLVYNSAKCERDVGKILEAVGFDFALNSNYRTLKAAHAYLRESALEVYIGGQKTATRQAIQYALLDATDGAIANVASDATAIARIKASARIIDAVIFGATNEGSVCQTDNQNAYYAILQLERNRDFIVEEIKNYVKYNFVEFDSNYNSATCERDVGLIVDSVSYDLITGSNFASSVAGAAYYRAVTSAQAVVGNQKRQTLAIIKYIRRLAKTYVQAADYPAVYNAFTNVYEILDGGLTAVPTYTFPDNGTTASADSTTAATFIANRATYVSSVSTYLNTNYNAQWVALGAAGQAKCERDTGYIIDAITYDVLYGGNYQSVIAGDSYYSYGTLQIDAGGEKTATLAAYGNLKATLSAAAEAASQAGVEADMDNIIAIITNGAGTVATTYPSALGETASIQTSFSTLQSNKATLQSSTTTYITNTFSSYTYNEALCLRDVGYYIDALKYDLYKPGNYSSRYVARFYNNSVTGSQEEDMFYLRDATGVRNCTLNGLNGQLLPENAYNYSKVSAGAYCSLDPGWGPDDFRTWIITRSPYIQGVTTFGNAATGQKIDGALHNGGNDSMVSNDFTQVISDGIGAHILNNGRAELVSVFTYYSHVGYLAETGGRVRATNGNNSYGDFGSVATGVDPDETAVTAIVDSSTQYNATISQVQTNQVELYTIEYGHAGNDYTEAKFNIFGPGSSEVVVADEFRDGGFNYAYVDQNADPDVALGGSGYVTASNVAQSGSLTGIFLAATDGNLSSAYPGMKIYIIGGAGVGQYAIVNTYNAGTKEVTVIRESDGVAGWDHVVPGTPIVAPNSSSTYQIEPRATISAPTNSNAAHTLPTSTTWYNVEYVRTAAQYTGVSHTGGNGSGATFDVTRNGSKYYVTANAAGIDYSRLDTLTIVGTDVGGATTANDITITVTSVNSITGAIIDFDFTGSAQSGRFLAVGAGTNGAVSIDGNTWTAEVLPTLGGGNWASIADGLQDDGSSTFQPSAVVVVADGDSTVAYSADGDTWSTGSLPGSFNATGENTIAFGQIAAATARFVVISDADQDVAYSDNGGQTWSITGTALPANGYGEMAYGAGKFVAINSGTTSAAYSTDGITWTGVTAPAAFAAVTDIVWGNGKFVALGGTNGTMYSLNGITWYENALTLPLTATERKLAYGQGTFVITSDDTDQVQYSHDGLYWQAYTLATTVTGGYNAIAFGNPAKEGKFVILPNAAGTGGNTAKINTPAKGRASIANQQVFEIRITEPGSGYTSAPTITITDPNNVDEVDLVPQIGNGVLANPTFVNRGTGFTSATAEVDATNSNGGASFPQAGAFIAVRRLTSKPVNGSNVEFASLPGKFFKLVNVLTFLGTNDGSYTGFLQVSPNVAVSDDLPEADPVEMRIRFSQVRLTGHDFLDIGTGGFTDTNYPGVPTQVPIQANETADNNGGRVFYTATDQDGNFRVGDLFTIEQSTGVATLNADAFNIAGLQELSLGEVTLGGNSATVNEFSTDPFFTANSDNVIPTQRAVKAYIEAQIGGGGATLNVNSVTAGDIFIGADTITTLSGTTLNIKANVVFSGTVLGVPLAYNYFLR